MQGAVSREGGLYTAGKGRGTAQWCHRLFFLYYPGYTTVPHHTARVLSTATAECRTGGVGVTMPWALLLRFTLGSGPFATQSLSVLFTFVS